MRASTSAGANYEEARGGESRADFAHKIGVTLKELRESRYWLRLIREVPFVEPKERLGPLVGEADELVAIISKTHRTLRTSESKRS